MLSSLINEYKLKRLLKSSYLRKGIIVLFYLLSIIGYGYTIRKMMFPDTNGITLNAEQMLLWQKLGSGLLLCCMLLTILAYYALIIKSSAVELIKSAFLSITVLILCFLFGEYYFLHFAASNAIGDRWSNKLWDRQFMTTRTPFDYTSSKGEASRAYLRESPFDKSAKKKKIWFIGDSFTYGFGIEKTENTFPSIVEQQLHGQYVSINLGDGGAAPFQEKDILLTYDSLCGASPDFVVWQYFGNDIDVLDLGPDRYAITHANSFKMRLGKFFFQAKTFFLDYLYWEYFTDNEQGAIQTYIDFLNTLYRTDSVLVGSTIQDTAIAEKGAFQAHLTPIKEVAALYKKRGVKFVVVVFPFLWKDGPENAEHIYTQRVVSALNSDSIDVMDLTPLIKPIPLEMRIVNNHDPHPSMLIAKMAGDTIANYIQAKR